MQDGVLRVATSNIYERRVGMKKTFPTCEKSSAVDNAAKMREALNEIKDTIDEWRTNDEMDHWQYSKLFDITDAALVKPPRNCDRPECATTKEAQDVWRKEDGGQTAYYEWLFAEAKGYEK